MLKGGFDNDEVLVPLFEAFATWYNREYRADHHFDNIRYFELGKSFGVPGTDIFERFEQYYRTPEFTSLQPYTEASGLLRELQLAGDTLHVISGRPPHLHEHTRERCAALFPSIFASVHLVGHGVDTGERKGDIIRRLELDYFVDDRWETALAVAELGVPVFVPAKPWNTCVTTDFHPLVERVESWRMPGVTGSPRAYGGIGLPSLSERINALRDSKGL
jgi:hypothetical protein